MRNQRESLRRFDQIYEYSDEDNSDGDFDRKNSIIQTKENEEEGKADAFDYGANLAKLLGKDYKAVKESIKVKEGQKAPEIEIIHVDKDYEQPKLQRGQTMVDIEMDADSQFDDELEKILEKSEGAASLMNESFEVERDIKPDSIRSEEDLPFGGIEN